MKHSTWKKVRITPALMDVFVCVCCRREKRLFDEERCHCDEFRQWEEAYFVSAALRFKQTIGSRAIWEK
jgi:hypothetical protein